MRDLAFPTRLDWRRTVGAVRRVLGRPRWAAVAVVAAAASLTLFATADSPVYLRRVVLGGSLSPLDRVRALAGLLPSPTAGEGLLRGVLLVLTAGTVGTNVSLLGYHLRNGGGAIRNGSGGVVGVVLATLGAGCASCGLAVVASALSLSGVAAGLTALPLAGAEFLLLALAVTGLSINWVAAGIERADIEGCPAEP
jgi:hypothetical protein